MGGFELWFDVVRRLASLSQRSLWYDAELSNADLQEK